MWSVSRHQLWERCQRAYFLEFVAPRLPRPPVAWHVLEALRARSSFGVLRGQAVHAAIAHGIGAALAGQAPAHASQRALDATLRGYARRPAATIAEVANGFPPGPDALEAARAEGQAMVARFFAELWPRYAARRYVQHEQFERFRAAGSITVRLRPDLVTAGPEGLLVSDWKTGHARPGDAAASLQLSTYLLWVARRYLLGPDRAAAELVFVASGEARPAHRTAAELARAEAAIAASARAMSAVEGVRRVEDAPPSPGPQCAACKFATVCAEGMAAARADALPAIAGGGAG